MSILLRGNRRKVYSAPEELDPNRLCGEGVNGNRKKSKVLSSLLAFPSHQSVSQATWKYLIFWSAWLKTSNIGIAFKEVALRHPQSSDALPAVDPAVWPAQLYSGSFLLNSYHSWLSQPRYTWPFCGCHSCFQYEIYSFFYLSNEKKRRWVFNHAYIFWSKGNESWAWWCVLIGLALDRPRREYQPGFTGPVS